MALWDGRFSGGPAEAMQRFSESLSTDLQMWREDIQGSRAHATMLHEVGILTEEELRTILDGHVHIFLVDARGPATVELFCDPDTATTVDRRWKEYFPDGGVEMGDSSLGHLTPTR